MKKSLSFVVLMLFCGAAFAFHCPADMKKIDEALGGEPELSAENMSKVKELRSAGEQLHNNGKHHAAVAVLAEAMRVLEIK